MNVNDSFHFFYSHIVQHFFSKKATKRSIDGIFYSPLEDTIDAPGAAQRVPPTRPGPFMLSYFHTLVPIIQD
jgi:hypothetical protein